MIIRKIIATDIDKILELNQISVKVLSPLDKTQLLRLIDMSVIPVVVEEDKQVAAFLLVMTEGADYDSINYQWFCQHYDSFYYVDRIVVSNNFRSLGIASKLYKHVIDNADNNAIPCICAEIDVLPPNEASLLFHKKFGFKQVESLKHSENKMVSLQTLKLNLQKP